MVKAFLQAELAHMQVGVDVSRVVGQGRPLHPLLDQLRLRAHDESVGVGDETAALLRCGELLAVED